MSQVFISYSRKDLSFVEQLASDLKRAGLDVWYDLSRLDAGEHWRREIENAIRNSQYVIVVLSPDSVESEWVEREFLFASNLKLKLFPIMYRECELPLNYLDLHYIDVRGENYQKNLDSLLQALNAGPVTIISPRQKIQKAPNVAASRSFSRRKFFILLIGGVVIFGLACITSFIFILPRLLPEFFTSPNYMRTPISTLTSAAIVTEGSTEMATQGIASNAPNNLESPTPPLQKSTLTPTVQLPPNEIIDGYAVTMRLIPAGDFFSGSDQSVEEQPIHIVFLDSFYLDEYEVTNLQYQTCVDAGVCASPKSVKSFFRASYYGVAEFNDYPVVSVDWNMAKTYCEWRDARLPTEAEWEKATRGIDARIFPWGDAFNGNLLNYCDKNCPATYADQHYNDGYLDTSPVGSYEDGKSQYGIYDLAGNVWEWVADWYSTTYYQYAPASNPLGPSSGQKRVLLGGSWSSGIDVLRSSYRSGQFPNFSNFDVGFRCAKSVSP